MPSEDRALVITVVDNGGLVSGPQLARWLRRLAPGRPRGLVEIVLAGDARVRALNRRFRGINRTPDVLSFPMHDESDPPGRPWDKAADARRRGGDTTPRLLGSVVIARDLARRQAARLGHSVVTEVRLLSLHGLLHLLGYDHEQDAGRMARLEQRLRRRGGLPAGVIERGVHP